MPVHHDLYGSEHPEVLAMRWIPRALAIAMTLFIASFALDAVHEGLGALALHLVPASLLAIVIALSWHREWIAGAVFIALALGYAAMAWSHKDWVLIIGIPLALVGVFYLVSWRLSGNPRHRNS